MTATSAFVALCLVSLAALHTGCASNLLLHTSTTPVPVPGADRRILNLNDAIVEVYSVRTPACADQRPQAIVLELPPNFGRAEWNLLYRPGAWDHLPVEIRALNYPGYGGSTGPASLNATANAALAAYDDAAATGLPVFISAYSIGTAPALFISSQRTPAGLYLYAPVSPRSLVLESFGWWNLWLLAGPVALQVPTSFDSFTNARNSTVPALIVVGTRDTYVPTAHQRRVLAAYAGPTQSLDLPLTHDDVPETHHLPAIQAAISQLWTHAKLPAPTSQPLPLSPDTPPPLQFTP